MDQQAQADRWGQLLRDVSDHTRRKTSLFEDTLLPNVKKSFLDKLDEEYRTPIHGIPVSPNVLPSTEACCVQKGPDEWHICVDYGLIEVLLRFNAAIAAFLSKAPKYIVHQLIMMACLGYRARNVKPVELVAAAAFDRAISDHVTDDGFSKAFQFFGIQLEFIVGHEFWHALEPSLTGTAPKLETMRFNGPAGKENKVVVGDPRSEVAADEFAGCAIGGFFTGDYESGLVDLSMADAMFNMLELCNLLGGLPLFRKMQVSDAVGHEEQPSELPITTHRGAALEVCRGMVVHQHNVPQETLKKSYFLAAVARRICNEALAMIKSLPQDIETVENLVRWHDARETGNWDIFFRR